MNVYFAHGKESGPWGIKIEALAQVARLKGFSVESHDYTKQRDPDARVEQLLNLRLPASDLTVLVGSSMGGYVATVATQMINPVGLFLMAPAFNMPGYQEQNPIPHARKTVVVHGLNDGVVPVENSIRFAQEHGSELHLLDGDHTLTAQLPKIEVLFDWFLDDVLELSNVPKIYTWEKIALKFGPDEGRGQWLMQIWQQIVKAGYASYRDEAERRQVLLRFIALTDFYHSFLSGFSRDCWGDSPEDTALRMELPAAELESLLSDYAVGLDGNPSHQEILDEIARTYVYPILRNYFGTLEAIAASIYRTSYPTYYDENSEEFLVDPEEIDPEEIARMDAFRDITLWLEGRLADIPQGAHA